MATIIGNRILSGTAPVGTDVPGGDLTGYQWQQGTNLAEWNPGTSQWVDVGSVSNTYYGLLSRGGGSMSGAITGPHGLAPVNTPNFTTSAKLDNVNLATVDDLADLETKINATIDSKISSAIATSQSAIALGNNLKITRGILSLNANVATPIPQPNWPDGSPIPWSNSVWAVYAISLGGDNSPITNTDPDSVPDGGQGIIRYSVKRVSENPATVRVSSRFRNQSGNGQTVNSVIVEYIIISVRN